MSMHNQWRDLGVGCSFSVFSVCNQKYTRQQLIFAYNRHCSKWIVLWCSHSLQSIWQYRLLVAPQWCISSMVILHPLTVWVVCGKDHPRCTCTLWWYLNQLGHLLCWLRHLLPVSQMWRLSLQPSGKCRRSERVILCQGSKVDYRLLFLFVSHSVFCVCVCVETNFVDLCCRHCFNIAILFLNGYVITLFLYDVLYLISHFLQTFSDGRVRPCEK